jgi:integrase
MTKNKINFIKKTLEDLPSPEKGKRSYYYDIKIRGLGIAITDTGTKTFIVYRKIDSKPERVTLGKFPDLSIENARKMAEEVNSKIAQGKNPNEQKRTIQQEITLGNIFNKYMNEYAKNHKKTWKGDLDIYKLYLPDWSNKKISLVQKTDITALHNKIGNNNGKYAANRMIALLHTIYNKAIEWGYDGINPCSGIKKFKEKSRERFLQTDELPRFFESLNAEPNETFRDYFYISLLTGARRGNVMAMSWKDINLNSKTWRIQETKNGEAQIIHLSNQAIEILKRRLESRKNDWVFSSPTSASGHIEEPKKTWSRILNRAGIEDLRIHDLRRTLGSWQAATGANSYIIGKSLGHKTQQATAIYARLNLDPVRESVNKATEAMFAAGMKK